MKRAGIPVLVAVVAAAGGGAFFLSKQGKVPEPAPRPHVSAPPASAPAPASAPEDAGGLPEAPEPAASGGLELPKDAPRTVRFGVILVQYQGAELAPGTAPPKAAALERARSLLPEAVKNFEEATRKGDRGSTADAGEMPRGVLEPKLEYALFTLKKGEVCPEPLDTPRGFWILRRVE